MLQKMWTAKTGSESNHPTVYTPMKACFYLIHELNHFLRSQNYKTLQMDKSTKVLLNSFH